ncbi:hypothetical protein Plec18170_001825 [Paecilomyces lecythidis]
MTGDYLEAYPLAIYAAEHWAYHYRQSTTMDEELSDGNSLLEYGFWEPNSLDSGERRVELWPIAKFSEIFVRRIHYSEAKGDSLVQLFMRFFDSSRHVASSLCLYHPDWPELGTCNDFSSYPVPSSLYLASLWGLVEPVEAVLHQSSNYHHVCEGRYGSALAAAAYQGWTNITNVLLNYRGDTAMINFSDGQLGTAISAAALSGHNHIISMLHQKGADVNVEGGDFGFALQAAAVGRHISTVELLLHLGADPNAHGGNFYSALHAAANRDDREITRCLLDHGADPNVALGRYGTPVGMAAARNQMHALQLLVEEGHGSVNVQGGKYGSPIQTAVAHGHEEAARFLLEHGANVYTQGGFYGDVITAAKESSRSNSNIVRLVEEYMARGQNGNNEDEPR